MSAVWRHSVLKYSASRVFKIRWRSFVEVRDHSRRQEEGAGLGGQKAFHNFEQSVKKEWC